MPKKRFSAEQIVALLRQIEVATDPSDRGGRTIASRNAVGRPRAPTGRYRSEGPVHRVTSIFS